MTTSHVRANTPSEAIAKLPRIGDFIPGTSLRIVQFDVAVERYSFFDRLFGRSPLWEVKWTFERQDESRASCDRCGNEVGVDGGPPDGWELDNGQTVCQACCVKELSDIIDDHSAWSRVTFGPDATRGPVGPLKHLAKESAECIKAIGTSDYKTELADCLLLLMDAARRGGVSFLDVVQAAKLKMIENKARTWQPAPKDEPAEHVR